VNRRNRGLEGGCRADDLALGVGGVVLAAFDGVEVEGETVNVGDEGVLAVDIFAEVNAVRL